MTQHRVLDNPDYLWRSTAAAQPDGNSFAVFAGELFLAMLIDGGPVPAGQITRP